MSQGWRLLLATDVRTRQVLLSVFAVVINSCGEKETSFPANEIPSLNRGKVASISPSPSPGPHNGVNQIVLHDSEGDHGTTKALSFKKVSIPFFSEDLIVSNKNGANEIFAFKSVFENSMTFVSVERSKSSPSHDWKVNARKYELTDEGFSDWPGLSGAKDLFPECGDVSAGQNISSLSVIGISDKFRIPAFDQYALPDHLTHVQLQVQCRSLAQNSVSRTFVKIINLASLDSDSSAAVTPLAAQKNIVCSWPQKKIFISADGRMYNFRMWEGSKIPGNFSSSGHAPLSLITECFEVQGMLHIKTDAAASRCFNFNIEENLLLEEACQQGSSMRAIRPFEVFHDPYASLSKYSSSAVLFKIKSGNDVHVVGGDGAHLSGILPPLQYSINGASVELSFLGDLLSQTEAEAVINVGQEEQYGQRIFGWSHDRTSIYLSEPMIGIESIESIRNTAAPLEPEPSVPFAFEENVVKEYRQFQYRSFPLSNAKINLISRYKPAKYKIYEVGHEQETSWIDWAAQISYSHPAPAYIQYIKIRFADENDFVSEEFDLASVSRSFWLQEAFIKSVNLDVNDYFGRVVAISGDTLVTGAHGEDSSQTTITNGPSASADNSLTGSGAVYVYKRINTIWAQEAYLKAVNSNSNDYFGYSIALSGDTLAVASPNEDSNQTSITNDSTASSDNSASNAGAVYLYKRNGSNWVQQAFVKAANSSAGDNFGSSLSLSGDVLVVGSSTEDSSQNTITNGVSANPDNSSSNSGAAYIYRRTGSEWAQEAFVKADNAQSLDYFGTAVSVSRDTLAVGAPYEDSNQNTITNGNTASGNNSASSSGAVYVYRRGSSGWSQEAFLKASNAEAYDYFGYNVSLSFDTLAVTAYGESSLQKTITQGSSASADNSGFFSGAVFVFRREGNQWAQEAYIKPANAQDYGLFGSSGLSISDNLLAIGHSEDSVQNTITNGITASDDESGSGVGAVFVYRHDGQQWAQEAYIKPVNAKKGLIYFGGSVSIEGDSLAVGSKDRSNQRTIRNDSTAPFDTISSFSDHYGAVYVYRRLGDNSVVSPQVESASNGEVTLGWTSKEPESLVSKFRVVFDSTPPLAACTSGAQVYDGEQTSVTFNSGAASGSTIFVRICGSHGTNTLPGRVLGIHIP